MFNSPLLKRVIAASIFIALGAYLASIVPTVQIAWVSAILLLTIYLFVFEIVDVDVAAVSIMVLLGLTALFAPWMGLEKGLVDNQHIFDGFSSNAVMSIIAVMIIGAGLDKTGIMSKVASFILSVGGSSEKRVIPIVSSTVAVISSFMQNIGAAALFLPVISRISSRSGLPMSKLLMPMGFCAILGGTMTMVGSSPLILLNDLIITSNTILPAELQMKTWGLFSVTPIGIVMILTGIIYFVIAGRFVLPITKTENHTKATNTMQYFKDVYGLNYKLFEVIVTDESDLIGKNLHEIETDNKIRVLATKALGHSPHIGHGAIDRDTGIQAGMVLGVVAAPRYLGKFVDKYNLRKREDIRTFAEAFSSNKSGIAEIVIPPRSKLIGKSAIDIWMRKRYGLSLLSLHRDGGTMYEGDEIQDIQDIENPEHTQSIKSIRDVAFHAGDTLVVHTDWESLMNLEKNSDFVIVTTDYPREETRPHKVAWAGLFFAISISMVLFTDIRLSVALLTGAIGMIISGVLKVDEAYQAVSWKTVFLLASLIPLGLAVEQTGTAKWIADQTLTMLDGMPIWMVQLAIAVLATFFTLVMSNVGATVLLVPLAVNIAVGIGADPAVFALTVAIATSNSFLIPTHQVNALIMGPGGYRVPDFIKAGSVMTILFLVVMMVVMNLIF